MRLTGCFLILLINTMILSGQQQKEIKVSCSFIDVPFEVFVNELEQKNNLQFFYLESWIDGLKVNVKADTVTISSLMALVLKSTGLGFVFGSPDRIYLLPDNTFIQQIPDYFISDEDNLPDSLIYGSESRSEEVS